MPTGQATWIRGTDGIWRSAAAATLVAPSEIAYTKDPISGTTAFTLICPQCGHPTRYLRDDSVAVDRDDLKPITVPCEYQCGMVLVVSDHPLGQSR